MIYVDIALVNLTSLYSPPPPSSHYTRIPFHLTMPAEETIFCNAETTEFLSWPNTPADTTQSHRCPNTTTIINRTCSSFGVWESVDPSLCTPFTIINVVSVNVDLGIDCSAIYMAYAVYINRITSPLATMREFSLM